MRAIASRSRWFGVGVFGVTVTVVGLGCGGRKEAHLPPARGDAAAALPALPAVGAKANSEGTTVATTDNRTTGTTLPRSESQIGPNSGGVIAKIFVKEGDRVRRGMILFRQLTRDAELRVEQAKAALASARVNLKATEVELARTKGLFEQKAVSQMEWDQIQARADAARAGVQQAEVAESIAAKSLADCTVRSPIDGVVASKLKSEGEMATMMPPTVVLVVQDQSVLELRFRLPEGSLGVVKPGQVVQAKFESLGVARPAKVTRLQPAVDPRTHTIEIVAEIPNKDGALRSGLLAEVELPETVAAAVVPEAAVAAPGGPVGTGHGGAGGSGSAPPGVAATAAKADKKKGRTPR